jgi:hypothetical protein
MPMRLPTVLLLLHLPGAAHAACQQVRAETDIIGIRLNDTESTRRVLGPWQTLKVEQEKDREGADADFPFVRLVSSDGKQEARLFAHYGDIVGSYNEIEVRPRKAGDPAGRQVGATAFATERGIKLGLSEKDVVARAGPCFVRKRGEAGERILAYAIEDEKHPLLKRSNMPSYFARYAFVGGRLAWFRIGLDYP